MANLCRKIYFKYFKCLVIIVLIAFFVQILIALKYFPSEENAREKVDYKSGIIGDVSARKSNIILEDDEDLAIKNSKDQVSGPQLRLEELDFTPPCDITSKEAISAIHRAKTQDCKRLLVNTTCQIQSGNLYPKSLPNSCPNNNGTYGTYLGCYQDEKKFRLLSGFYGNFAKTNSPEFCLDICVQAGLSFAGVQYETECFCGESRPPAAARLPEEACSMRCPGDRARACGGYFTVNVYETGLGKFTPQTPRPAGAGAGAGRARVVFLLTLSGRALRQVHRLINALYRDTHYFYIHVDSRQDYLHRGLVPLTQRFPNIVLAPERYNTIWGGASLLQTLLTALRDVSRRGWRWDYVVNLSESDFPIKSLGSLERFLAANPGLNFVKSHGREVQRFIKKQGLDKTFVQCEGRMWRLGARRLPRGPVLDGGSDWLALSPPFVSYLLERDELVRGLETVWSHTLLPAESFFHTALRSSRWCGAYVDNNLHVTNWRRALGCRCQHRAVVDWCGCSPNDFRAEDWPRILATKDRQLFFARKFEPIISQSVIARVEKFIGYTDLDGLVGVDRYWQSVFHEDDAPAASDDVMVTHASSVARRSARASDCGVVAGGVIEVHSLSDADVYKGSLVRHRATARGAAVALETHYKPIQHLVLKNEGHRTNVKVFKVSSQYDQKESTFRNLAGVLGPFAEPALLYEVAPSLNRKSDNFTVIWLDPAGRVADAAAIHVQEDNHTSVVQPALRPPLLPGVWKVLLADSQLVAYTKFLITPLERLSGKPLTQQEAGMVHGGSQASYKDWSALSFEFLPDADERLALQQRAVANSKRLDADLREWIDSLSEKFYKVVRSCAAAGAAPCLPEPCARSPWSSLSPDPKGTVGVLNARTGRLERS